MPVSNQFVAPEKTVTKAAITLPATTTATIFNVTGMVEITRLIAIVTTAVQAQPNAVKYRFTPTGGSVGDVSGTVDINGAVVGSYIIAQGPTTAGAVSQAPTLVQTTGGTGTTLGNGTGKIVVSGGALGFNAAATSTGAVRFILSYLPIAGGSVTAA